MAWENAYPYYGLPSTDYSRGLRDKAARVSERMTELVEDYIFNRADDREYERRLDKALVLLMDEHDEYLALARKDEAEDWFHTTVSKYPKF